MIPSFNDNTSISDTFSRLLTLESHLDSDWMTREDKCSICIAGSIVIEEITMTTSPMLLTDEEQAFLLRITMRLKIESYNLANHLKNINRDSGGYDSFYNDNGFYTE